MFLLLASLLSIQVGMTTGRPVGKEKTDKDRNRTTVGHFSFIDGSNVPAYLFIEINIRATTTNNAKFREKGSGCFDQKKHFI